ncbi:MAG: ribonuclease III [Pseudomonadota bacterium]
MSTEAERLQRELGVAFDAPSLLTQALTHKSASSANNERLEFLGDAILGAIVADDLYERHPNKKEDSLSLLRAALVNRSALAAMARSLSIGAALNLGSGELRSGVHDRDSVLADAFEAIIGAIYLDRGFEVARTTVLRLFADALDSAIVRKDAKTRLQEWLQARGAALPNYVVADEQTPEQDFIVTCELPGRSERGTGQGGSRRAAEQAAAAATLRALGEEAAP